MRVDIVGGGPAGLFLALLLRRDGIAGDVRVYERHPAETTYGWAVVFPEGALDALRQAAPEVFAEIIDAGTTWTPVEIRYRDTRMRVNGNSFHGIPRTALLGILQRAAHAAGVELHFGHQVTDVSAHRDADLLVGADGVHSVVRQAYEEVFRPRIEPSRFRHIWYGVERAFPDFTYVFRETEWGLFRAYCYPSGRSWSSLIVHLDEETWQRSGLSRMDEAESVRFCEKVLSADLDGGTVLANGSSWVRFPNLHCDTWHHDNVVLIGDAAHTAHWSIGSGTRLGIEDAIALAAQLRAHPDEPSRALAAYQSARWSTAAKFQRASRLSERYFENVDRYLDFAPIQFAYQLMARSWKVTHADIARRDPDFVARFDGWFHGQATARRADIGPSPAFAPLRLGALELRNRVVSADDRSGFGLVLRHADRPTGEGFDSPSAVRLGADVDAEAVAGALTAGHRLALAEPPGPGESPASAVARLRALWPADLPVGVVLPVDPTDEVGHQERQLSAAAEAAVAAGAQVALLEPAPRSTVATASEVAVRMVQAADAVRNVAGLPVIVAGAVRTLNEIDTIVAAGWADCCVLPAAIDEFGEKR
jgi:anthraniloyl-CoA monooxygenase